MKMVQERKTWIRGIFGTVLRPWKYYRIIKESLSERLPYRPSKKQIWWCYKDYLWFQVRYWGAFNDYFNSQMYRKSDFVRAESLSRQLRFPWRDALQRKEDWVIFKDKREFYQAFSEYLNRDWMIVDSNTSWEDYIEFLKKCSWQVFAKDPLGYGGKDVSFQTLDTEEKQQEFFAKCGENAMIIEEKIEQCEEMRSFSNSSVNTIRIITLIDRNGKPHVAKASFRIGSGSAAMDNFSSGGVGAAVDVETGIVCTMAIDSNGKEYIFHPDTGKQIVGYQIADWGGYKEYAIKLVEKYPEMRYVGWDIAKDVHGNFCVIEGNKDAGVDLQECSLLYGLKPYYEAVLNADELFDYSKIH